MDKVIKNKIISILTPHCNSLRDSIRDFANQWLIFEDMQDHLTETLEEVWNEALETAASEADTNGDFATANSIRTYILKDKYLEFPYE